MRVYSYPVAELPILSPYSRPNRRPRLLKRPLPSSSPRKVPSLLAVGKPRRRHVKMTKVAWFNQ